ncbi:MAG: Xaa-Pro peptidase family protein [Candidatus Lokiarchaeota archaeon]|nr:Xaa-Pro peptidase family protein [Candidatus Lokiarchaeota archaeon]
MRPIAEEKFESILKFLEEKKIDVLLINDNENSRNVNLQYLTGHPTDATVLIKSSGESFLIPWDVPLAEKHSEVDEIINPANFSFNSSLAMKDLFEKRWKKSSITVGVHSMTTYGSIVRMKAIIPGVKYFGEPIEITQLLEKLRATKTELEIENLVKAAEIGTKTINDIKDFCKNNPDGTEKDLSFTVRKKIGDYGGDDVAFEPLVANSSRAHEIHQYPFASNQKFGLPGLALIDFGAKFQGYNSEITVPISFGKLSDEQIRMREFTIKSYEVAIEMIDIDVPLWKIHDTAEQILKKGGYSMPYSLGHGLGLTVHDSPLLSRKPSDEYSKKHWKEETIQDGMVFTIEPGAYKQGLGGQRLENDFLIRNGKVEIITSSKPLDY